MMKNGAELLDPVKRTTLGENLYAKDRRKKGDKYSSSKHKHAPSDKEGPFEPNKEGQTKAKAELNSLASLLGTDKADASKEKFTLKSLFPDNDDASGGAASEVIYFNNEDKKKHIEAMGLGQFWEEDKKAEEEEEEDEGDDLLALMDREELSEIYGAQKNGVRVLGGANLKFDRFQS